MKRIFELRWRLPLFRRLAMWIARHTPSCTEMARLSSQSLDGALPLRQRLLRLAHFIACDWCFRYAKQLRFLRTAAHALAARDLDHESHSHPHPHPHPHPLRADARERLKHRLTQEGRPPSASAS